MVLTTEEPVIIVEHVFREGGRYRELARQIFADKYSDKTLLHRNVIRKLVDKLRETGLVYDAAEDQESYRRRERLNISDSMQQCQRKILRKLALQQNNGLGITNKSVRQKSKFFPYKIMAV